MPSRSFDWPWFDMMWSNKPMGCVCLFARAGKSDFGYFGGSRFFEQVLSSCMNNSFRSETMWQCAQATAIISPLFSSIISDNVFLLAASSSFYCCFHIWLFSGRFIWRSNCIGRNWTCFSWIMPSLHFCGSIVIIYLFSLQKVIPANSSHPTISLGSFPYTLKYVQQTISTQASRFLKYGNTVKIPINS